MTIPPPKLPPPPLPPPNDAGKSSHMKTSETFRGRKTPQDQSPNLINNINSNLRQVAPIDAAAELIQHLDESFHTLTTSAQNAQDDSRTARQNAQTAMDIARRYTTRSYHVPKAKSSTKSAHHIQNTSNKKSKTTATHQKSISPRFTSTIPQVGTDIHMQNYSNSNSTVENTRSPINILIPPPSTSYKHTSPNQRHDSNQTPKSRTPRELTPPSSNSPAGPISATSSHQKLAQSHAEDVLTLSLELEQTKAELEKIQESSKSTVKEYTDQIKHWKEKVEIAEEDANTALELARESTDSRIDMEHYLDKALQELEAVKKDNSEKEKQLEIALKKEEEMQLAVLDTSSDLQTRNHYENGSSRALVPQQPRALVAMGRDVLNRRRAVLSKRFRQHKLEYGIRQRDGLLLENGSTGTRQSRSRASPDASHDRRYIDPTYSIRKLKESAKRLGITNMNWYNSRNGNGQWRNNTPDSVSDNINAGYDHNIDQSDNLEAIIDCYSNSVEVSQ